jgi:hypothetical protein
MNRVNFQQGLAMTTVNQNQEKTIQRIFIRLCVIKKSHIFFSVNFWIASP